MEETGTDHRQPVVFEVVCSAIRVAKRAENDAGKTEDGCAFPPQMPTVHMLYAKQL